MGLNKQDMSPIKAQHFLSLQQIVQYLFFIGSLRYWFSNWEKNKTDSDEKNFSLPLNSEKLLGFGFESLKTNKVAATEAANRLKLKFIKEERKVAKRVFS